MPAQAQAGLGITANNRFIIDGAGQPIRRLFIQNLTTNGNNLVFFMSDNPSGDQFVLRPGQFKIIPETETHFEGRGGLWCTDKVRVQPLVAGTTITAFDYDIVTWDRSTNKGRYQ